MVHVPGRRRGSAASAGELRSSPAGPPAPDVVPPVRTKVIAARPRDHAFDAFVRGTGRWWPVGTQVMAPGRVADVRIDPWLGGRVVEVWDDASEHLWGTVVGWCPPCELTIAWQAHDDGATTEVTVRFAEASIVTCWVEVTHDGWSALGAEAPALREGYRVGWSEVLGAFLAGI